MPAHSHALDLSKLENREALAARKAPYWNILEYCRHIGFAKLPTGARSWMARIRCIDGRYKQKQLASANPGAGIGYSEAVQMARHWFAGSEIVAVAAEPYPIGVNRTLNYSKSAEQFTVGDAMHAFVEWKRIAAAKSTFETNLSLINYHIIPRLGDFPVDDLNNRVFAEFCRDLLETSPELANKGLATKTPLEQLDHERLRKRKKTLNTVIGLLRVAIEMAWENGDVKSERCSRILRRVPHADTPRQFFLTRKQAKSLIAACRPDLALLVLGALYTGCRVSELARIKARDVGGHVFGVYVEPLKSRRGRYVILPDEGMSFFLDQVEGLGDEDPVFTMASGKPWSGCHKHLFRDAVRRADLPKGFVFHGLRHTYASQLVQAGTPLSVVAKQLGHSNAETVSRTYGHLCCDTIEAQIATRFARLHAQRSDPRLDRLRDTLQTREEPNWSWPESNHSRASGEIVTLLKAREEELKPT